MGAFTFYVAETVSAKVYILVQTLIQHVSFFSLQIRISFVWRSRHFGTVASVFDFSLSSPYTLLCAR
jgi:hypothetical protein